MLLALLLLVSCKSKKNVVSTLPRPVLNMDSVSAHITDTTGSIARIFTPDHSQLKDLNISKSKKHNPQKQEPATDNKYSDRVLRGTKITSSTVKLSSTYAGIGCRVTFLFCRFISFRIYCLLAVSYPIVTKIFCKPSISLTAASRHTSNVLSLNIFAR